MVASGEEGLDQGGVQKEFFQTIIEIILDPSFGSISLPFPFVILSAFLKLQSNPQVCSLRIRFRECIGSTVIRLSHAHLLNSSDWFISDPFSFSSPALQIRLSFGTQQALGLAIFNGVIVGVNFPLSFYKLLLSESLSLDDLAVIEPVSLRLYLIPSFPHA